MSEPVSIRYKCKFCGNQQNKSLRSGPPNPASASRHRRTARAGMARTSG